MATSDINITLTREELAKQLDDELEEYIKQKVEEAKNRPSKPEQTIDEIADEINRHPAFMKNFDPNQPLDPLLEGLQALKYDDDDAIFNAENFKDDGNQNFKWKKYAWAIANYTEGIKLKPPDKQLNAVLYTNRAAANFHLQNYRSSLNDAVFALKFSPDHKKALSRVAHCLFHLNRFEDCLIWVDKLLIGEPDNADFQALRTKTTCKQSDKQRDERKRKQKERKEAVNTQKLFTEIAKREIKMADKNGLLIQDISLATDLSLLATVHPSNAQVYLDSGNILHWPVVFLYPEYGVSDFINDVIESDILAVHIEEMFGKEMAPWDTESKYKPEQIEVFYEQKQTQKLHKVAQEKMLCDIITENNYVLMGGAVAFIIIVKNSAFAIEFKRKYKFLE